MDDYYKILGIPKNAPQSLVRIIYKSLVKIYHPDLFQGDLDFATTKLKELNEAYAVISDPQKRKEYDAGPQLEDKGSDTDIFSDFNFSEEYSTYKSIIDDQWKAALEFIPNLELEAKKLERISNKLSFVFKATLIETKGFSNYLKVVQDVVEIFFTEWFGDDLLVHRLILAAIEADHKSYALDFHKAVSLLGNEQVFVIINKLEEKYPNFNAKLLYGVKFKPGLYYCFVNKKQIRMRVRPDFKLQILDGNYTPDMEDYNSTIQILGKEYFSSMEELETDFHTRSQYLI